MRLFEHMLTHNRCYLENRKIYVKGIMVHSTGANNPRIDRYVPVGKNYSSNHWDGPQRDACVHAFVGLWTDNKVGTCQTLPWNMRGWHSGVSGKPNCVSANNTHIGFEICEDDLKHEDYFKAVMEEATDLCALLCHKFALDPIKDGVIIDHHEGYLRNAACNHADITHWLKRYNKNMDWFRRVVSEKFKNYGKEENMAKFIEQFDDMQSELYKLPCNDWAKEDIAFLKEKKITDGSGPQALCTREMVMAMIARAMRGGNI